MTHASYKEESGTPKLYFPGLNGLRFIAASAVFLLHIQRALHFYFPGEPTEIDLYLRLGSLAVSFFFTLSGFLITSLLIEERRKFGRIDITKFYVRRALRIWPLYYFVAFLGLVVLPMFAAYHVPSFGETFDANYWKKILLYLFWSPHAIGELAVLPYALLLWSVGVEEWFYSFWPWVARRGDRFILIISLVILFLIGIDHAIEVFSSHIHFLTLLRFDCMAVGALAALLLLSENSILKRALQVLFKPAMQFAVYVLTVTAFEFFDFGNFEQVFFSLLFALIILNVGANHRTIVRLENPVMNWLGDRSYGLYCYNWIAAVSGVLIVIQLKATFDGVPVQALALVLGAALTLVFASLSYRWLEQPFLRLKKRRFEVGNARS